MLSLKSKEQLILKEKNNFLDISVDVQNDNGYVSIKTQVFNQTIDIQKIDYAFLLISEQEYWTNIFDYFNKKCGLRIESTNDFIKFKDKEFDILVSTTVVEVGVDVPNATVIVIENADRFGLSQLHQLRGRVGRSDLQSYCLLSSNSRNQDTRARLDIMTQTNDGFVIAEKDLQIRGPGEFLGTRQSGLPDMIIADLVADSKILELARSEAIHFAKNYDIENFPLLKTSKGLNFDGDIFNS